MAHHDGIVRWTVVLLCIFMTFQVSKQATWSRCTARTESATTIARGVDERMVNLTVKCDRDVAHLKFSTGGLHVRSIRLAQECIVLDKYEHNGSDYELDVILSRSTSQYEGWKPNVSPTPSQHLWEFGVECHYFGCYLSDPDLGRFIFTFPIVTCTFSVLSNTPVKSTTYSPQMSTSVVNYPSETNSTRQHPGGHSSDRLLQIIFAGVTVTILLLIPVCVSCLLVLRK